MSDISKITNPEAKRFLTVFLMYRSINRKFYELVPEEKFDFRMTAKSDSVRENLAHIINLERAYLLGVADGKFTTAKGKDETLKSKGKKELLKKLEEIDQELVNFLGNEENLMKKVSVKWNNNPISVVSFFWAMNDHEILHNGINIATMDHLNMKRFPELKAVWG